MTLSVWSLKDCQPAKVHHVHCALCTAVRPMAHDPSSQSKLLVPESRTSNLEAIAHVPFCPSFWYQTNLVDYTSRIRDRLAKLLVRELVGLPLDLLLRHGIRPKFSAPVTDTRISYYSNFANVTCILAQDLSGTRNLDRIEHAIFQDEMVRNNVTVTWTRTWVVFYVSWAVMASPAVLEILDSKRIGVTSFTFHGRVTSSITWPLDTSLAISYWRSFGTKPLSLTVSKIFNGECNAMVDMTLNDL